MKKMKAYATFDLYLADKPPKSRTLIRALRKLVNRVAPKLEESVCGAVTRRLLTCSSK